MRNKIDKYFFDQFISSFALVLISLTAITWVAQSVNYLDFVTEDGHSFSVYFYFSLLNLPKIFTRLIPFVFLISLFFTVLQFEKDNELLIFWTSGLNKIRFVNIAIKIALLITLLQLLLAVFINPHTLSIGRGILKASDIGLFPSLLKEKKFNDTVEGLTVFVEEKKNNGELIDVFLRIDSSNVDQSKTIIAERGLIVKKDGQNILILFNGTIQTEKIKLYDEQRHTKINFLKFYKYEINLSAFTTKTTTFPKLQERSTIALLNCFDEFKNKFILFKKYSLDEYRCRDKMEILVELNRRLGMPFYIPITALIICYLLSSRRESKYFNFHKYVVFSAGFAILVFAEILVRYSEKTNLHSVIYYFTPLLLLTIIYFNLIKVFKFENLKN